MAERQKKTDITEFSSIKDVPKELIHATSRDGKTLVLKDGTKVSDRLIADAKTRPKGKEAAAGPATAQVEELLRAIVNHPDFESAVRSVAAGEARRVFAEGQKAK